jgi:hypothetical protein
MARTGGVPAIFGEVAAPCSFECCLASACTVVLCADGIHLDFVDERRSVFHQKSVANQELSSVSPVRFR